MGRPLAQTQIEFELNCNRNRNCNNRSMTAKRYFMKIMKNVLLKNFILVSALLLTLVVSTPGWALRAVYCTNCSDQWTQMMERGTSLEQLRNTLATYQEAIMQTTQQIELVRNNIQQYQNMIKNTLNLPANLLGAIKGEFANLAKLTNELKSLKGDVLALGQVFDQAYPDLDMLKNLASGTGSSGMTVKEVWDNWSKDVDEAAKATFQLTGSQLQDIAQNSETLEKHISDLLSTPEGQMQAVQSGNSLAAIQIDELRQLRALMATSIQMTTQMAMKDEKREQLSVEQLQHMLDTSEMSKQYQGYK